MITTLYEGFGLPALEAMSCDCPVVAKHAGSLPEVCGQAAFFVDPKSADEIGEAMTCLTTDPGTRKSLIESGRSNWQRFRWKKTARQVCRVIRECLQRPHH